MAGAHDPECESRQAVDHYDGSTYCASCGGWLGDSVARNLDPRQHRRLQWMLDHD